MTAVILVGDCVEQMRFLPDKSVNTCVTSPPYFGLRDYDQPGQLGLEPTPAEFVAALVTVFREVRRVLRDDGTVWLNLGDSYAGGGSGARDAERWPKQSHNDHRVTHGKARTGLKNKQLLGIPWRVAFALQDDDWFLRQDIIWSKPNPMTESVKDRCTNSHEHLFLLSKSPRYYFDGEAIREPAVQAGRVRKDKIGGNKGDAIHHSPGGVFTGSETRNRRSVWTVSPKPFKGAHFATFPPDLIEPCILAGAPPGGVVLDPFGGSGTVGMVAEKHGRDSYLIDLNPDYVPFMLERIGPAAVVVP